MIDNVSTTIQQKLVVIKDANPSIRIERAFLDLKFGKIRSRLNNKYVLVVLLTLVYRSAIEVPDREVWMIGGKI